MNYIAERRMEEVVAHRVLLREEAFRQVGSIIIAHDQSRVIRPGDEARVDIVACILGHEVRATVLDRASNLELFIPEAVDNVAGQGRRIHGRR